MKAALLAVLLLAIPTLASAQQVFDTHVRDPIRRHSDRRTRQHGRNPPQER